jgi:hypothetical protein
MKGCVSEEHILMHYSQYEGKETVRKKNYVDYYVMAVADGSRIRGTPIHSIHGRSTASTIELA